MSVAAGLLPMGIRAHPLLEVVYRDFEREELRWCLLRAEADAENPRGDIDLLVQADRLGAVRRILYQRGFVVIPARGYGPHVFFLRYDQASDRWIKLDVVTRLAFGRWHQLESGAEGPCLERRRPAGAAFVPDRDDAFWTLLLHALADTGGISPDHRRGLEELAPGASVTGPLARVAEVAAPRGWGPARFLECVERADWPALEEQARTLERTWERRLGRAARARRLTNLASRRLLGRLLFLTRRRGLSVALLAPDGAGKSTLAEGVLASSYFPARSIYMGLRGGRGGGVHIPGLGLARKLATQWKSYLSGCSHRFRGRLVIFDRYTYDALLPPPRPLGAAGKARRWLLARACPPPNLAVVLDAPAEELYRRKGEHGVAVLEQQRRRYLGLSSRLPRSVVIDASLDAEEVRRRVMGVNWETYAQRLR
ncbi:MAG: hypothetical protein ACRDJK_05715, partial [Actinomycetota bacterium]